MFWGCISKEGPGPLVVIGYLLAQGVDFRVMHCNAPCHTSAAVKAYSEDWTADFLEWPPQSPDLNPTKNVWTWVKCKLYTEYPPAEDKEEFIEYVLGENRPNNVRKILF